MARPVAQPIGVFTAPPHRDLRRALHGFGMSHSHSASHGRSDRERQAFLREASTRDRVVDPVCRMEFAPERAAVTTTHDGSTLYFCSAACHERFLADPEFFERQLPIKQQPRP